ncbi:hypothetical protein V6N13_131646 [Hibiscus sabdariffa]|uniref:Uncharacterized protein n=1 Tax=Hibiscus sabdariffa TaxID=183260 RepID=A0ABR2D8J4_9ROSI
MRWLKSECADSYYQVKPECKDVPATRFKIKPGRTLSVRKWLAAFSPNGQLDIRKTLKRIHRGEANSRASKDWFCRDTRWRSLSLCCSNANGFVSSRVLILNPHIELVKCQAKL